MKSLYLMFFIVISFEAMSFVLIYPEPHCSAFTLTDKVISEGTFKKIFDDKESDLHYKVEKIKRGRYTIRETSDKEGEEVAEFST